ncbi:hypothetical protein FPRO04_11170 [Fusarium proliferatum]|nr:hypothetical protein FPRO03_01853 [Fusarium proliferatum]KAG4271247.1 hypothetical protein FPRO04_11170 [Fusarium proliferatum]
MYNNTYPNVRQFLRIPFAQVHEEIHPISHHQYYVPYFTRSSILSSSPTYSQRPPIGDLRFEPPEKPLRSSKFLIPLTPALLVGYSQPVRRERRNSGAIAWSSSKDCLALAVWAPSYANKSSQLPVALFVAGGGGLIGGINLPSQLPEQWVSCSQEHIVVAINYLFSGWRANLSPDSKSRALQETLMTLLDVRASVEWVHKKIEYIGGARDNALLWGESQGARLVDMYTTAFWGKPRVAKFGIISNGPNYIINTTEIPDPYADFDVVAKSLGSDKRYIFSNKSDRYAKNLIAREPAIRSTTATELEPSPNFTHTTEVARAFDCFAFFGSKLRNYSNISPGPWLGAYHWTDLVMIFGAYVKMVGDTPQAEGRNICYYAGLLSLLSQERGRHGVYCGLGGL